MTELSREAELPGGGAAPAANTAAAGSAMTREEQLCAARRLLGLPHPADVDDVTKALRYIEILNNSFLNIKKRHSKQAKQAAGSLVLALQRAQSAGLPMPAETPSLILLYHYLAITRSTPKRGEGFRQRLGLQQAHWLLGDRNRRCIAGPKSEWCKLAAILLGMPKATPGLVSQARELRAQWKRSNPRQK